jgi:uncharacterized protein (TIGR03118 family)
METLSSASRRAGHRLRSRRSGHAGRAGRMVGVVAALTLAGTALGAGPAAAGGYGRHRGDYVVTNLVSDQPGRAPLTDPQLVNPWGMALGPTSGLWVSDNHTDVSTIYTGGAGTAPLAKAGLVVSIPGGAPTGQAFNTTGGFAVTDGTTSAPAVFVFAAESGRITGWNPTVPPATQARPLATTPDAIYKGVTVAVTDHGPYLYATDFHNGKVDVFDAMMQPVVRRGAFRDPFLPPGFAPFDIMAIGDRVFVTYAKQDAEREDDVAGAGAGFIDTFSLTGRWLDRFASRGVLNAPWGLAVAPHDFGRFSDALLVGNFGDGHVNAFTLSGHFLGTLRADGRRIAIEGLWGLTFGNGTAGATNTLFFTAGPGDEQHGLLGTITVDH